MSNKRIYLDHAASTPLHPKVLTAMKPFLVSEYGNPSTLYRSGVYARKAVETAREQVAKALSTNPDMIVFTSGGTEGNNIVLLGACKQSMQSRQDKIHIITTQIEHSSVLEPIHRLEREGCLVTYLPVDTNGYVTVDQIKKAIKKNTVLISIGYANNEIGTIQPISKIGKMILKYRRDHPTQTILFHTDACQAINYCDIAVERLHVDLMTLNGSKIYGPKGVGALFVRRGVKLEPIMYGGGQESGLRSGTENVAGIIGLGQALELVEKIKTKEVKRLKYLQQYFWKLLSREMKELKLNGCVIATIQTKSTVDRHVVSLRESPFDDVSCRLPNNFNIRIPDVEAETFVLYLDAVGIECSAGSACSTDSFGSSHVLHAIGLSEKEASECIRFTLGQGTSKKDIEYVIKQIKNVLRLLQS